MNEVLEAIARRRSIRSFTKEEVADELIAQIVKAGLQAPSGKDLQDVIILVVRNEKIKEMFREANGRIAKTPEGFDNFFGAPVYLVVLAQKGWRNAKYDGALAMGSMMLAAHSLGLGSCWINRAYEEFELEEFQELLKQYAIPGEWEGVGHLIVGHINGEVPSAKKIREGRVYYLD